MALTDSSFDSRVERSQQYFNKVSLFFYDLILYGVISKFAWGCSIRFLDAQYRQYATANHLEVGVGTGFLLNRVVFPGSAPRVALMDLSPECLEKTRLKVTRYAPQVYRQNLLEPVPEGIAPFTSIAINYVMHCVPGRFQEKGIAFTHLLPLLSENGVLFGSSVLSQGVHKNLLAKPFMWLMNHLGVFNNREDNARDLEGYFRAHFSVIEFRVVGVTAIFAVKPLARRD